MIIIKKDKNFKIIKIKNLVLLKEYIYQVIKIMKII